MGKKLYVGNLSYNTTSNDLERILGAYGTVKSAQIINDRDTGRSKGFGFVEMVTEEDAQKAMDMFNGKDFDGRRITVSEARPMEPRPRRDFGGNNNSYGRE